METITRVRYNKQENGILVSKPMFAREFVVVAKINGATNSWKLVKNEGGEELTNGQGKTMALAKKAVKVALKAVGVNFLDESRGMNPQPETVKEGDET